ncbi:MAG: GNAT family N-acetyltransferase [Anaerolineae bacterium]
MTTDGRPFLIRLAQPQDRNLIIENINRVCAEQIYLESDCFVPTPAWETMLADPGVLSLPHLLAIAELDGTIAGHVRCSPGGFGHKDYHVADVGIALIEPYREKGIGSRLLEYAIAWASQAGYLKLTATVFETNTRALRLFRRCGFEREGRRARQFQIQGRYIDEVLLARFMDTDARS